MGTSSRALIPKDPWSLKKISTRLRVRLISSRFLKGLGLKSQVDDPAAPKSASIHSTHTSRSSPAQPPPYILETTQDALPLQEDEIEGMETVSTPRDSIYIHSSYPPGSLEDLFFASQESLPPFPDTVNEIVDLIRMAASLLYREMQLVLVAETQAGIFPTYRADTWARLGQLHRLISSWPDTSFTALDGIQSFKQSLNDGTILCEFVKRLVADRAELSPCYGPEPLAWVSNLQQFTSTLHALALPETDGHLVVGTFDDMSIQDVADYARAVITVQERFGPTATSLHPSPPSRSPRSSVSSFTSRLRISSLESFASRRSSARPQSQRREAQPLNSIYETEDDDETRDTSAFDDNRDIPDSDSRHLGLTSPSPGFLSVQSSIQSIPEPIFDLPKETKQLYRCLLHIMSDEERYRTMLETKGSDAQELLDFLQHLLDYPQITGACRNDILTALVRLSTTTNLYPQCFTFSSSDLQIDKTPVASGHFGEVMQGVCQNQWLCIKVIKLYQRSHINTAMRVFLKEAVLWKQLRHPNLLPFYGVYRLDDQQGRICLISPWMENGTVVEYLRVNPDVDRLLLVRDIVRGLSFLHDMKIVHGDLKGANILVTEAGRACLADFGLSSLNDVEAIKFALLESSGHIGGTPRWEAPELLDDTEEVIHRTPASDVYAFGCVCYEISTGRIPFFELTNEFMVYLKVARGERPKRPSNDSWLLFPCHSASGIWTLITHCWAQHPTDRPKASEILKSSHLGNLLDNRPGYT